MFRNVNRKPISYGLVRVASADSTNRIASIFLRSILNALERFREVEYRFAALVVNILVVIRIRLGMTRPNPRRMTVRSLFCHGNGCNGAADNHQDVAGPEAR